MNHLIKIDQSADYNKVQNKILILEGMGHNRKKQRNHGRQHHQNPPVQQYQPKRSEQELQMQCLEIYELLSNKTKLLRDEELEYCFLLSTKWLEDWKDYVGYYNLTEEDARKHKKLGKKHPGKINHELTTSSVQFYTIPEEIEEEYGWMNAVVSEKKEQGQDFIGVAKALWEAFASKYEHVEVKRPKRTTKKSVLYDSTMIQLDVIVVDWTASGDSGAQEESLLQRVQLAKHQPKDLDDYFTCDKMQLSELWELSDLEEFCQKYCLVKYGTEAFTLWKGQGYTSSGLLQRSIWDGIKASPNSKEEFAKAKFPVPCRRLQGEKYEDLDLDEFIRNYYTLVLEVGENHIEAAPIPEDQFEGYCEECVNKKQLLVRCQCNEMFYCSDECRVVDQVWHYNLCNRAFESEDDQQFRDKSISKSPQPKKKNKKTKAGDKPLKQSKLAVCGLDNLGNTCYMNSVLQSLMAIEELVDFFGGNQYQKFYDKAEYEDNKCFLLDKYSKSIKQYLEHAPEKPLDTEQDQSAEDEQQNFRNKNKKGSKQEICSYSPWSLKGAINYFLSPFKGFKQHDANDFLVNMINCFNEQLQKDEKEGKMFHQFFEQKLIGQFESVVECPDCHIEIKNDEIFSQISLPLKPAPTYHKNQKPIQCQFIIFNDPSSYIKDKLTIKYDDTWEQIRKTLNLRDDCFLMLTREGEYAVDIEEFSENDTPYRSVQRLKRDIIFYPNCKYQSEDDCFSLLMVGEKQICGQKMKAPYGYPALINTDSQVSMGSFWIKIITQMGFFEEGQLTYQSKQIQENFQSMFKDLNQKFVQKRENKLTEKSLQEANSESTEKTQEVKSEREKQEKQYEEKLSKQYDRRLSQISKACNQKLKAILKEQRIDVHIIDQKRHKGICSFCKRKCNGCPIPVDFSLFFSDYTDQKTDQISFELVRQQRIKVEQKKTPQTLIESQASSNDTPSLQDSLSLFSQPQQLDEENAWYCYQCDMMRLAYKKLTIKRLPPILILHLNRFKTQGDKKVKNSDPIFYEQYEQFQGKKYRLLSVIVHEGAIDAGHYWSISLRNNGKYYIFNDAKVVQTDKILNKNAYILIYSQVS